MATEFRATYRLQLHDGFTLDDAGGLVPYLRDLGVSHLYLSPIFKAREGSTHGYDVIDPTVINPELGGEAAFRRLVDNCREHGLGIILDIVPNHMAAHEQNPWWYDVLRHGQRSTYAGYFDIEWEREDGRIFLPFLGSPYAQVLREGHFLLGLEDGVPVLRYFDREFALRPETAAMLVLSAPGDLPDAVLAAANHLQAASEGAYAEACAQLDTALRSIATDDAIVSSLQVALAAADVNEVLQRQHYRLGHWRVAAERVNYRRFFDINDLAGVRVEDEQVFQDTHRLIDQLAGEGAIDGLRIDHIDGLRDPAGYLSSLAGATGNTPAWVEKIVDRDEWLPPEWPVAGTTGYEFMGRVDRLFMDPAGLAIIDAAHGEFAPGIEHFPAIARAAKGEVIDDLFEGELDRLAAHALHLIQSEPDGVDLPAAAIRHAIRLLTVALPRYRTYITPAGISPGDREVLQSAAEEAQRLGADTVAVQLVLSLLEGAPSRPEALEFALRWQQFTGPVTAKGVEDTAMYRDNRLLALNEVGRSQDERMEGLDAASFHRWMERRSHQHPLAMNASATHDTKRGEDARYRLAALTGVASDWVAAVRRWHDLNAPHHLDVDGGIVPLPNTESGLYQAILGTWPGLDSLNDAYVQRIRDYAVKAARERSLRTSWLDTDRRYEGALTRWVTAILDPAGSGQFLAEMDEFACGVASFGRINAVGASLLKGTCPGIPDIYQGTETEALTLVDPDNRRPVDFGDRQQKLADLRGAPFDRAWWTAAVPTGLAKLATLTAALETRRRLPAIFAEGDYRPLDITGRHASRVIAFARIHASGQVLVVVPLLTAVLAPTGVLPDASTWGDTRVETAGLATRWRSCLGGSRLHDAGDGSLALADLLADAPVALLESSSE